jgi:aminopeptidase-like protein
MNKEIKLLGLVLFLMLQTVLPDHVEKGWRQMVSYHDKIMFVMQREVSRQGVNAKSYQKIYTLCEKIEKNQGAKAARERCQKELKKQGFWGHVTTQVAQQIKNYKINAGRSS